MTPQDISCATFIAKHILHQQQTVTDVQTKNLIPSVKYFLYNSDKANEYTNRPDPVDEDDEYL